MQAVILAGGLGTRLRPLTLRIPKPMVPSGNRPFLYYQLKLLKKYDISEIVLLVGYLGGQIQDYFGDGSKLDLNIRYSFERKPMGTAGSLKLAEELLRDEFFIIYGDSYLPINYTKVKQYFKKRCKMGLLVVYDNKDWTDVNNNVALDKDFNVMKYKKRLITSDNDLKYVEAWVSVFKKQILGLIKPKKAISLEQEVFPGLIKENQLIAFVTKQRFYDIGTYKRLKGIKEVLK